MQSLTYKKLSDDTEKHLLEQQQDVNSQTSFENQVKRAKSLWGNKDTKGGQELTGKKAFDEVRDELKKMGKAQGVCHYCEHDRNAEVEHIYPKTLFPNKCFVWDNYLYICGICNKHKGSWCKVFHPATKKDEREVEDLGVFPPSNEDIVLINPRIEHSLDFIILDLAGKTFRFLPISEDTDSREYKKAYNTIKLLHLNADERLPKGRQTATQNFLSCLKSCVEIRKTQTFEELEMLVDSDFLPLDKSAPFENEKKRIFDGFKEQIMTSSHPTVWEEMKRQREHLPKTKALFEALPEALTW